MRIHALTVCVNYSDMLAKSLDRWRHGCDSLIVVTSHSDDQTAHLCAANEVSCFKTSVFYERAAFFNKGAAIALAYEEAVIPRFSGNSDDWVLFIDADIIPPADWRVHLEMAEPEIGNLYGAHRYHENGRMIRDELFAGYFNFFNAQDANALIKPIVDTHWSHAGNYDTMFQNRWNPANKVMTRLPLTHVGECGMNWCGRDNQAAMFMLRQERRRRRGWQHERIAGE